MILKCQTEVTDGPSLGADHFRDLTKMVGLRRFRIGDFRYHEVNGTDLLITAFGFGYGLFNKLDENSRLKETEWLYRRERTLYRTEKDIQLLMNHEKEFFPGTTHEQDSIKQLIRYWEQKGGYDKTFLYFRPTED